MLWRLGWVVLPILCGGAIRLKQTVDVRRPALIRRDFEVSRLGPSEVLRFATPFVCAHQPLDHTDKQPDPLRRQIHLAYSAEARDTAIRRGLYTDEELCLDVSEVAQEGVFGPHSFGDIIRPTQPVLKGPRDQQRVTFDWCDAVMISDLSSRNIEASTVYRFRNSGSQRGPERPHGTSMSNTGDDFWKAENETTVLLPLEMSQLKVNAEGQLKYEISDDDALALLSSCKAVSLKHHETILSWQQIDREFYVPAWTSLMRITESYSLINKAAKLYQEYHGSAVHNMMARMVGTRRRHEIDGRGTPLTWTVNAEFPRGTQDIEYYDEIGNISTSTVVHLADGRVGVELEPRYPLLGSWKARWQLRYHTPAAPMITQGDDGFKHLSIVNSPSIRLSWAWKQSIRVILPPGSHLERVDHGALKVLDSAVSYERHWLDILPSRPVITISLGPSPLLNQSHAELKIVYAPRMIVQSMLHLIWVIVIVGIGSIGIWGPNLWGKLSIPSKDKTQ